MTARIRIFQYVEQMDGFLPSDAYQTLADELGLTEWHPAVWIGRLFLMDNDFGEHWFDNWDIREQKRALGNQLGYDEVTMLFLDPKWFVDGRDGPCHSADFRKRFWTDVLRSLELDIILLFDEARSLQKEREDDLKAFAQYQDGRDELIPDLESRIARIAAHYKMND